MKGSSMKKTSFEGAEEKGREAARQGLPISACPYTDKRKPSGKLSGTISRRNGPRPGPSQERRVTPCYAYGPIL